MQNLIKARLGSSQATLKLGLARLEVGSTRAKLENSNRAEPARILAQLGSSRLVRSFTTGKHEEGREGYY